MINIINGKRDGWIGEYIGRTNYTYGLMASPLANPFKASSHTTRQHQRVVDAYRVWIYGRIDAGDIPIIRELGRLRDIALRGDLDLCCWCHPLPCHALIIKEIVENASINLSIDSGVSISPS